MDCSLPGSSVHGIFQARTLEWVAISFSRGLPNPGIEPGSPALQADPLPSEPPGKPLSHKQTEISDRNLPCAGPNCCLTDNPATQHKFLAPEHRCCHRYPSLAFSFTPWMLSAGFFWLWWPPAPTCTAVTGVYLPGSRNLPITWRAGPPLSRTPSAHDGHRLYPACRSGPSLQGPAPSHLPFCASVSLLCELDHPTNSSVLCLRVQGRRVGCWEETGGEGSCGRGIWWWMQSIRLSLWPTCSWVKGIRPWWSTDNLSNPGRRWGRIPEAPSPSLQQNRVPFSRPCALQQDKSSEVSQLLP